MTQILSKSSGEKVLEKRAALLDAQHEPCLCGTLPWLFAWPLNCTVLSVVMIIWCNIRYKHRSINNPMNNKSQAYHHQLALECVKFGNAGYRRCGECFLTNDMVNIKFVIV